MRFDAKELDSGQRSIKVPSMYLLDMMLLLQILVVGAPVFVLTKFPSEFPALNGVRC